MAVSICTIKALPLVLALLVGGRLAPGADAFATMAPLRRGEAHSVSVSNAWLLHLRQDSTRLAAAAKSKADLEPEEVRRLLEEYLEKRVELNADELAKQEKGKIIGGTKGNKILDYVSGAPAKEQVVERIPNIFDYDELTKYGYSNLVTPIMNMGGRRAVYDMMDMEPPPLRELPKKKPPVEIKLDRTGEEDPNRFKGVRMGLMDDDLMGEALARANEKAKKGESLRSKIMEEEFERPFVDKRNTGPRQTPDWTVERLDEYMETRGRSVAVAKEAELENYVRDTAETWDLSGASKAYMVFTLVEVSFAFGRSTPIFLRDLLGMEDFSGLLDVFQAPALGLVIMSLTSAATCGWLLAPPLNRSTGLWALKGFLSGPLAIAELRGLEALQTGAEALREKLKEDPFNPAKP